MCVDTRISIFRNLNLDKPYIEQNVREKGNGQENSGDFPFFSRKFYHTWLTGAHILYIYIYIQNRKVDLSTRQDNLIPRRKERRHLLDFECCSCPICKKVDVSTSLFSIVKANLWKYIYIKEKIVDQWKIDRGEVIIFGTKPLSKMLLR